MKNIKGILPGNLACGFGAIIISGGARNTAMTDWASRINEAVWLIILAAFFDKSPENQSRSHGADNKQAGCYSGLP